MSALEDQLAVQIKWAIGVDFQREHRFHPVRRWRFDFAFPEYLVACEVEGGTWNGGRHTRGKGFEGDCEKYNEAALAGWLCLRVTGSMVQGGEAVEFVRRALEARGMVADAKRSRRTQQKGE
jgi:hypothetical protein